MSLASDFIRNPLTWDEIHAAKRWGTCPEPAMARWAKRLWQVEEIRTILDLGCGIGANAVWLAEEGFTVAAIDESKHAIERLKARDPNLRSAGTGGQVVCRVGDVCKLPYGGKEFNGVIDVTCLQHLVQSAATLALREAWRVLKPGGHLFSMTATDRHDLRGFSGMFARHETRTVVASLYRAAGFEIAELDHAEHTDRGMTIAHWLIHGVKPR